MRWTAAAAGKVDIEAVFTGIAERATTDVHVLHNGRALHDGQINLGAAGNRSAFEGKSSWPRGDTIDCVVGYGNGSYGADSTALALTLRIGRRIASRRGRRVLHPEQSAWRLVLRTDAPGAAARRGDLRALSGRPDGKPRSAASATRTRRSGKTSISDRHVYPRVPHTADIVASLRNLDGGQEPGLSLRIRHRQRSRSLAGRPALRTGRRRRTGRRQVLPRQA